jgi:hypothetical protein
MKYASNATTPAPMRTEATLILCSICTHEGGAANSVTAAAHGHAAVVS